MHTHQTAPTQFIEAAGICFAYRCFGKEEGLPLVFMMHFTGIMDHWDPADGFARDRKVILFNNPVSPAPAVRSPTPLMRWHSVSIEGIDAVHMMRKGQLLGSQRTNLATISIAFALLLKIA